jgi:hypothetical protein
MKTNNLTNSKTPNNNKKTALRNTFYLNLLILFTFNSYFQTSHENRYKTRIGVLLLLSLPREDPKSLCI